MERCVRRSRRAPLRVTWQSDKGLPVSPAAATRHPRAILLDGGVQLVAVLVIKEAGTSRPSPSVGSSLRSGLHVAQVRGTFPEGVDYVLLHWRALARSLCAL